MNPSTLDHVAYWVAERDSIAGFLNAYLGTHVIERTERFTLLGSDARRGKLTLFDAEGPREAGPLKHVGLRVSNLGRALDRLPAGIEVEQSHAGAACFDMREGIRLCLVERETDLEVDLDHVALFSARPERTAAEYLSLGFAPVDPGPSGCPRVEVGGAWIEFYAGAPGVPERPLLNHLAVLVDSVEEHVAAANELGVEIDDIVDAPNTLALFVRGPDQVRIEYVEHKATFSLV